MSLTNLLKVAWRAVLLNKTRTLLTMLGIIIGVASVIAMLAIGEGSKKSIQESISSMGANMINIRPGSQMFGGVMDQSEMQSLKLSDAKAISENAEKVKHVSPLVNGSGQAIAGANNWPTTIYGVSPEYLPIRDWELEDGGMFTDDDVRSSAKVALIGKTIQEELFPNGEDPIGKMIRFKSIPFRIIGVLKEKGENTFGQDQDDVILAPYTTVQKRILAQDYLQSIVASSISEQDADEAVNEITGILEKAHKIPVTEDNDFSVSSQQEMLNTFSSTSEMLTVLLVAIAGISLLVGGIGIMNIMYVSVKERTKEIGLRMAIGAKSRFILLQFLIESVLISVGGGLIEVLFGISASTIVGNALGWPIEISSFSLIISFVVCTVTGVFFGWYPARKAAASDPIVSLRYE